MTRAEDVEAFKSALSRRIQALAHAHELLSESRWQGADLRDIARQELAAYQAEAGRQIVIEGPRVVLAPTAIQALSMTLHELATNAAKYGALSRPDGRLRLRWRMRADASAVEIVWEESGVEGSAGAPSRVGFGTRMIRAMIETQLGGTLSWDRTASGLRCRFTVPREHVAATPVASLMHAEADADGGAQGAPAAVRGRRLLLVEDEVLIAVETEARLAVAGFEVVQSATSLPQAVALAVSADVDAAVLDINLGGKMSFPVADALKRRGIPFVFMTGYRHQEIIPNRFKAVPVVAKPCAPGEIEEALARGIEASGLAAT